MVNKKIPEIKNVRIIRVKQDDAEYCDDLVTSEEPLEIVLRYYKSKQEIVRTLAVTMRTPGDDENLSTGFLFAERIIDSVSKIVGFETENNKITVSLHKNQEVGNERFNRNFVSNSSCGLCGKNELHSLGLDEQVKLNSGHASTDTQTITSLGNLLYDEQETFPLTGGLHACGLYKISSKTLKCKEDIGRHNALDKLIGESLSSYPLTDSIAILSGRVSYEMIQKTLRAEIPIVAAIGAPSSMAIEIANHYNQTLIGFIRDSTFNVYTAPHRIRNLSIKQSNA